MSRAKPLVVGSSFSITAGLGYTLCAIAFALFPNFSVDFTTSLFHGLNFSTLKPASGGFTFFSYLESTLVLMAWAFVMGAAYCSIYNRLSRGAEHADTKSGFERDVVKPDLSIARRA
jgi:hypothetical protein